MLVTLIQKEVMHHILSVRFVALLVMCLLLVPLTLSTNYRNYRQNLVDYQEAVKLANIEETTVNLKMPLEPELEVSKLFLKPTPLSVFANGLADTLPSYLGMTRNGITQGAPALVSSLSNLLGHLDFLFIVGTVFSLLALLFTFDAVAGEREAGTLRITLANSVPRDLFLWSKLIGGYVVFVVPFLVSLLFGLLVLVWQGFPLGEPEIFPRVLSLTLISLLYIGVFFAIGTVISTYLDNSKTALIVAFTVWVFAVLITPRVGFLAAKLIAPTRTSQSVYMEKTAMQDDFNAAIDKEKWRIIMEEIPPEEDGSIIVGGENGKKVDERVKLLEEEYRSRFQDRANKLDRDYKRENRTTRTVRGNAFPNHTDIFSHLPCYEPNTNRKRDKKHLFSNWRSLLRYAPYRYVQQNYRSYYSKSIYIRGYCHNHTTTTIRDNNLRRNAPSIGGRCTATLFLCCGIDNRSVSEISSAPIFDTKYFAGDS